MKKILLFALFSVNSFAQQINFDNSFGTNGLIEISGNTSYVPKLIFDSNQNIIGWKAPYFFKINNGTLDTSFGVNGFKEHLGCVNNFYLKPNGKIVSMCSEPNVRQFTSNYEFDSNFGTNGLFSLPLTNPNGSYININDIKVNNDNTIFAISKDLIYKINDLPTFDISFGDNGKLVTQLGKTKITDNNEIYCMYLDIDNKVYFAKKDLTGNLDANFGSNGKVEILSSTDLTPNLNVGSYDSTVNVGQNKVYVLTNNQTSNFSINKINLVALNSNGTFDTSFGLNGKISIVNSNMFLTNLFVINNKIFLTGILDQLGVYKVYIRSYNTNGTLNTDFANSGEYIKNDSPLGEIAASFLQNGNSIYFGSTKTITSSPLIEKHYVGKLNLDFSSLRYNSFYLKNYYIKSVYNLITLDSNEQITKLDLYSLDGKLLISKKTNQLEIDSLSEGIYILQITFFDGKIFNEKIVKK